MRRPILGLLAAALWALPALAQVPLFPQTLPPNTVVGRLGAGTAGPAQAIPFNLVAAGLLNSLCTTTGAFPVRTATVWQCSTVLGTNATLAGTLTINPTTGTTTPGFTIVQSGPSSGSSGADVLYNSITVSNDAIATGALSGFSTFALQSVLNTGGANATGQKYAFRGLTNLAYSSSTTGGDIIGVGGWAISNQNNGGTNTGAGAVGALYGFEGIAHAFSGATNYAVISGGEFDTIIDAGASAKHRWGVSAVGNGAAQGAVSDAALEVGGVTSAGRWGTALLLDSFHGFAPLQTTGCVICTDGVAATITTGIDLSAYTISGFFLKGAASNFTVDGSGNIVGATASLTATSNQLVFQSAGVTGTISWTPATSNKKITLPNGTTDFTATGGTSQVLKQISSGAAITVARLACADLSDSAATCSSATAASLVVGGTVISSGTNTRILYDNSGALGEYTLTGTGTVVAMQTAPTILGHPTIEGVTSTGATGTNKFVFDTSPTLVTPALGVATATSLAIGGCTIGTDVLCTTGTSTFSSTVKLTPMTTGSVLYAGASGAISQDNAKFFWDDTNQTLGIGTATPYADHGSIVGLVVRKDQNTATRISVLNNSTGASTASQVNLGTGTTSSSVVFIVSDNAGAPYYQLSSGAGILHSYYDGADHNWRNQAGSATWMNLNAGVLSLGANTVLAGELDLFGGTSGKLRIITQATAGTPVWTAGTASGTPAVTASSPLAITTATGNITCSTCLVGSSGGTLTVPSPLTITGVAITWTGLTSGGILYNSSTTAVASSALMTLNGVIYGGGAGASPLVTGQGGTNTILIASAGAPSFSATPKINTSLAVPIIGPLADSTTAFQITKADLSTRIVDVDTTNARVGINKTPGAFDLDVNGAVNFASTLAVTGHVTLEGVTSTGAAGTGKLVFDTTPTFTTGLTVPIIAGGPAAGSTLILESTSGVGTTDSITLKTGSQVARMTVLSGGNTGFGTETNPATNFVFSANVTTNLEPVAANDLLLLINADGSNASMGFLSYGNGAAPSSGTITGYAIGGTAASPSATPAASLFFQLQAFGHANGAYTTTSSAKININSVNLWSSTDHSTKITFQTTPTGSTTRATALTVQASGGISVGTGSDPAIGGISASGLLNSATTSAICYNTGTGVFTYDGTLGTCNTSDEALKEFSGRLTHSVDRLVALSRSEHFGYFEWNNPQYGTGRKIGIGAQTVARLFPELTATGSDGLMSLAYDKLTVPIIDAIAELKADNDNLRAEIEQVKRRLAR